MAEMYCNIYYSHSNQELLDKLDSLFDESTVEKEKFTGIAVSINSNDGAKLVESLFEACIEPDLDLGVGAEFKRIDGYSVANFVHGTGGDEVAEAIVRFIKQLVPDVHVQAWGHGDEDPWEYWLKYEVRKSWLGKEKLKLIKKEDTPFQSEDEDEEIRQKIYEWWHDDMPASIKEGYLNEKAF